MIRTRLIVALVCLVCASFASMAAASGVKVMTYNTHHGGAPDGQLDTIAAQAPDIVVLQEASYTQLAYYVAGLNSRLKTTAWHGQAARHCVAGTAPTCTTWYDGSVMILTRLQTLATNPILIWAKDDYVVARSAMRMQVALSDGTAINVFVVHLPADVGGSFDAGQPARDQYIATFMPWAATFAGTRLVGGDFNSHPTWTSITSMTQAYADAWATLNSSGGYTHTNPNVSTRLDYWFSQKGAATLTGVTVVPDTVDSDHRPVVATYTLASTAAPPPPPPPAATTVLADGFTSVDRVRWPNALFTGSTDTTIPVAAGGTLTIGPLRASTTDTHYNGITSSAYNLSADGYAYAQLVQAANQATDAYAMFAMGSDGNDFYRWYVSNGALVAERKIAGVKTTLVDLPYDRTADQFLRIDRQYNSATGVEEVVFQTAPNASGSPGTFTVRYREAWNTAVAAVALKFELEAGTSDALISPGAVIWDNFKAVAY